jgi:hypothetical protein
MTNDNKSFNPVMMGPDPHRVPDRSDSSLPESQGTIFDILCEMLQKHNCTSARVDMINSQHIVVTPEG